MSNKYNFDNMLNEQYNSYSIYTNNYQNDKDNYDFCLTEMDFYPPSDNRVFESYIEDIEDGDNFTDYCKYIFKLYEEEGYYDWLIIKV